MIPAEITNVRELLKPENDGECFWMVRHDASSDPEPFMLTLELYQHSDGKAWSFRSVRGLWGMRTIQEFINNGAQLIHIPKPKVDK